MDKRFEISERFFYFYTALSGINKTTMNKINKKSKIILAILFFGPLLFYLTLLTGTHQYTKLPILTPQVENISAFKQAGGFSFTDHVTVVAFFGKDLLLHKTNALNLNEKIYKNFYGYRIFRWLLYCPKVQRWRQPS
ncbi:MAG: hypothetical protein U5K51_05165 [Flavobacteriaceae bacterium]|nr:hypothetical protein [Flavobacteriaceae bacterium]